MWLGHLTGVSNHKGRSPWHLHPQKALCLEERHLLLVPAPAFPPLLRGGPVEVGWGRHCHTGLHQSAWTSCVQKELFPASQLAFWVTEEA